MVVKPGMRLRSVACGTELVVVRAPGHDLDITCGGATMVERGDASVDAVPGGSVEGGEAVLIGKRYSDQSTGLQVLCTKAGIGPLACEGRPLVTDAPKPLPSSD